MAQHKMLCTLGIFDIPIIQMQPAFVVDMLDSNIAVFGTSMSGKTSFLQNLIHVLHKQYDENQEQIFVLDFGGALFDVVEMPLVAAYFDNSNEEYVKRVFKILEGILKENIEKLSGKNFRDYDGQLIHTTFIIDNVNSFMDEPRYSAYQEKLAKLSRDGLSKGITIVFTAADTKGIARYLGTFKQKIAFEMPADKYADIFLEKVGAIGNNPGHGFANVTVKPAGITGTFRMNVPYELQCSLPFEGDAGRIKYNDKMYSKFDFSPADNEYRRKVKKYRTFPKELTEVEYLNLRQDKKENSDNVISLGLDYVDFNSITFDMYRSHVVGIYGKKEFGKTNLLTRIIREILVKRRDARIVLFDDGRSQLKNIYNEIKDDADAVLFDQYVEKELLLADGILNKRRLSPLQQFYVYLNENYISLDKRFLASMYGVNKDVVKELMRIPNCCNRPTPFTVFVIQSKAVYLNTLENKFFINSILPQLTSIALEKGYLFIFSDVQKMADIEQNMYFNNVLNSAFLLDNIAEFANERGQRTVFGNMDVKMLKEDYAQCILGDGYYYDIEADRLSKLKFIKV